jgi:Mor family transcriptional regulator
MSATSFVDVVADGLKSFACMPDDIAVQLAAGIARGAALRGHAGADYYLPFSHAADRAERNARIWAEFNGANIGALSLKFDLSEATVRRAIAAARLHKVSRNP